MNVERLLEFIEEILRLEGEHTIQRKLSKLDGAIQSIIANPQDPAQQTGARSLVSELMASMTALHDAISPGAWRFLEERDDEWTFDPALPEQIEDEMNKNGMTPAVVKRLTENRVQERQKFLDLLKKTSDDLRALGYEPEVLKPGETQIGFTVPRALFDNTLEGLSKEMKSIDRAIGFISEAAEGQREHATIAQLSTSDPLILVTANAPVVFAIGYAIKFFIARWAEVENIRKVREETRALKIANDEALKPFDDHLNERVESAIKEQIERLLPDSQDGRDRELETGLEWAFRYLMSRVERGMTVEIKFLPPPPAEAVPGQDGQPVQPPPTDGVYQELAAIRKDLMFNELAVSDHLLGLEAPLTSEPVDKPKKKRAVKPKKGAEEK